MELISHYSPTKTVRNLIFDFFFRVALPIFYSRAQPRRLYCLILGTSNSGLRVTSESPAECGAFKTPRQTSLSYHLLHGYSYQACKMAENRESWGVVLLYLSTTTIVERRRTLGENCEASPYDAVPYAVLARHRTPVNSKKSRRCIK